MVVAFVIMTFVVVVVAFVVVAFVAGYSLGRIRLKVAFEGFSRTQRFAFQARLAPIRTATFAVSRPQAN
jgi:hypothetical protein